MNNLTSQRATRATHFMTRYRALSLGTTKADEYLFSSITVTPWSRQKGSALFHPFCGYRRDRLCRAGTWRRLLSAMAFQGGGAVADDDCCRMTSTIR